MKYKYSDEATAGHLLLFEGEEGFDRHYFSRDRGNKYFTIAWNTGPAQSITIDGTEHAFQSNSLVTLLFDQSFTFEKAEDILAWQFNREFYCIIDHDHEVSCVGFLFGSTEHLFINLDDEAVHKLQLLRDMFKAELKTTDNIQHEMLQVLLKRMISYATRLARSEFVPEKKIKEDKYHLLRQFNLLVETHFRQEHSVSFYADKLHKSPKTLSNLFATYNQKSPSQVIQERVLVEAKRLLSYTPRSIKEIAYELGFEDAAYFSNFFKKHTQSSPLDFRNPAPIAKVGK